MIMFTGQMSITKKISLLLFTLCFILLLLLMVVFILNVFGCFVIDENNTCGLFGIAGMISTLGCIGGFLSVDC